MTAFRRSVEFTVTDVNPDVMRVLMGQPRIPTETLDTALWMSQNGGHRPAGTDPEWERPQ